MDGLYRAMGCINSVLKLGKREHKYTNVHVEPFKKHFIFFFELDEIDGAAVMTANVNFSSYCFATKIEGLN